MSNSKIRRKINLENIHLENFKVNESYPYLELRELRVTNGHKKKRKRKSARYTLHVCMC